MNYQNNYDTNWTYSVWIRDMDNVTASSDADMETVENISWTVQIESRRLKKVEG